MSASVRKSASRRRHSGFRGLRIPDFGLRSAAVKKGLAGRHEVLYPRCGPMGEGVGRPESAEAVTISKVLSNDGDVWWTVGRAPAVARPYGVGAPVIKR
jgi:hypothetical protein